jgi:hypothetical protein
MSPEHRDLTTLTTRADTPELQPNEDALEADRQRGKRLAWRVVGGAVGILAFTIVGLVVTFFVVLYFALQAGGN